MMRDDYPLATQTAAPPTTPPRRPVVGLAMTDDDDRGWLARLHEQQRQLAALLDLCEALRAENRATLERLRAIERRLS
jgi:gluconate kinase